MILLTPHPNETKLAAIEKAARKISRYRKAWQIEAGKPNREQEVSRFKFAKAGIILSRMEAQHRELLYY